MIGLVIDWCAATERNPLALTPADVDQFFAAVPCAASTRHKRIQALRCEISDLRKPQKPVPAPGETAINVWPYGMNVRRDHAVLAMLSLGLGRRDVAEMETSRLRTEPLPGIEDHDLFDADPARCPGCALTRWLRVLAAWELGGRPECSEVITSPQELAHDCAEPTPSDWSSIRWAFCAIDRHGFLSGRALTPRSISLIVQRQQDGSREIKQLNLRRSPWFGRRPPPDPRLDELLDRLEETLGALLARCDSLQ